MNLQYTSVIYPAKLDEKKSTANEIKEAVCKYFGVEDLGVNVRDREFSYPRHAYCYVCWKKSEEIPKHVMELIGRHRTSFYNSIDRFQDWHDTEERVRADFQNLLNILNK